jgi:hypothetical protein
MSKDRIKRHKNLINKRLKWHIILSKKEYKTFNTFNTYIINNYYYEHTKLYFNITTKIKLYLILMIW